MAKVASTSWRTVAWRGLFRIAKEMDIWGQPSGTCRVTPELVEWGLWRFTKNQSRRWLVECDPIFGQKKTILKRRYGQYDIEIAPNSWILHPILNHVQKKLGCFTWSDVFLPSKPGDFRPGDVPTDPIVQFTYLWGGLPSNSWAEHGLTSTKKHVLSSNNLVLAG